MLMTKKQIVFGPASARQKLILEAQEDIVLIGGGAGGK